MAQQQETVAALPQLLHHGSGADPLQHGLHGRIRPGIVGKIQILRPQQGLVLRLPQIQPPPIDELLHRRIHQIADVPVGVHRLPDAGGADLLQRLRQRQLQYLAVNAAVAAPGLLTGPAEDDVVKGMDGVRLHGLAIGGGVSHHVTSHGDGHLPSGEGLPQPMEVLRVGDVHREILREDLHMELVRHRHGGNAPPDAVGLGALGPRELIDGQQYLEAPIPDGSDNGLVGQGEGIEGTGEKGDGPWRFKGKAAPQPLGRQKAVQPPQHGCPIVEGQCIPVLLTAGGQQLPCRQGEGPALLAVAELCRTEYPLSQHQHGLLPGLSVDARQSPHQHPQQPVPAAQARLLRLLRESLVIDVVLLIDDAHGVQHRSHDAAAGGAEGHPQIRQALVQLLRRQPQGKPPQIVGNVLGELLLPQLQPPAQLHGDLIALIHRQPGSDLQQRQSCAVAHRDPVADLDEVRKMRGDV